MLKRVLSIHVLENNVDVLDNVHNGRRIRRVAVPIIAGRSTTPAIEYDRDVWLLGLHEVRLIHAGRTIQDRMPHNKWRDLSIDSRPSTSHMLVLCLSRREGSISLFYAISWMQPAMTIPPLPSIEEPYTLRWQNSPTAC